MPRKKPRPDSNGKLKRRKGSPNENYIYFRIPSTLKAAIKAAAAHESAVRGHDVSWNEWVTRACIDRLGEIFGTQIAKQFYQQFFNGLAAVHTDIKLPDCIKTNKHPSADDWTADNI